jgi:hypothetical protein
MAIAVKRAWMLRLVLLCAAEIPTLVASAFRRKVR